jgi:hypothetical protein
MDVSACIELHNRIAQHTLGSVLTPSEIIAHRGWFEFYGEEAENERETLTPEIVEFLENIDIIDIGADLPFTPQIRGIAQPQEIRACEDELWMHAHEGYNCIVLYQANDDADNRGLVLNLETHLCHWIDTIYDDPQPGWTWVPLQDALARYWHMIESGKYLLKAENGATLWSMVLYCADEIDDAVDSWNGYLDTISERLPGGSVPERSLSLGWIPQDTLDEWHIDGFARGFLLRAKRPPPAIKTIAPGLHVLHETLLTQLGPFIMERQHTPDAISQHREWATSFLLSPADKRVEFFSEHDEHDNTANIWRLEKLLDDRAGLYLTPSSYGSIYSDTVNMLTPWPVGGSNTRILGYGSCAYELSHNVRLARVLNKWKDLVVSGVWTVGPNGVEGGIDAWKEVAPKFADISDHVCL